MESYRKRLQESKDKCEEQDSMPTWHLVVIGIVMWVAVYIIFKILV